MGASNSTTVIKNGDWEHKLCWTEPPTPLEGIKWAEPRENFNRNSSLSRSLRILRNKDPFKNGRNDNSSGRSWQKLKPEHSLEETKNGIELASLSSMVTTRTEEMVI